MNPTASIKKMFRLLFFRISRDEMLAFNQSDLIVGLAFTWIVGIGRYWDDPGAKLLQHLGAGSVVYVFVLALFIWLLFIPFKIKDWSYKNILTFISLTSLPAIFYAIPVERFFVMNTAAAMNAYFLLGVAIWRVALYYFYLRRFGCLNKYESSLATFLPLTILVTSLTILNLERAVFDIMGGIREKTSNDAAYGILLRLTMLSMILSVPLLIGYLIVIYKKYKARKAERVV